MLIIEMRMVIMSKEWMTIVLLGHHVVVLVVVRGLRVLVAQVVVRLGYTGELRAPGYDIVAPAPLIGTSRLKGSTSSIPSV